MVRRASYWPNNAVEELVMQPLELLDRVQLLITKLKINKNRNHLHKLNCLMSVFRNTTS